MLSFATVVELTAIAKSCVEREKSFEKSPKGQIVPMKKYSTTCGRIIVIIFGLYL